MVLVFVVGYFVLVFLQTDAEISVAKNIVAGMAFAYGTAVGVHFWRPDSNLFWFLMSSEDACLRGVVYPQYHGD